MFQRFDEEARKVLKRAKKEMQDLKHPFVGTEHLMLSILKNTDLNVTKKLNEYQIDYLKFKKELLTIIDNENSFNNYFIYTPLLKRIIENAILDTREDGYVEVSVDSLFLSLLDEGEGVAIRVLTNMGLDIDDLYLEFASKDESNQKYKSKKKLTIYEFGVDLCKLAKENKIDPVIGRDKEINRLMEILLRRSKNNPILLGDAGVGKTAIVEGLALKIVNKQVPAKLLNKKIISISLASLVAGTKYRGEFEEKINKIIKELETNSDFILFIDEIHSLVGAGGAEGAIDASNIFKPALARGKLKLIGATTTKEYKDSIEKDKALARRFQPIIIEEPNFLETKDILLKIKPIYENYHQVIVPDDLIDQMINLANKYIFNRRNPDKTIDILDEVCILRSLTKDNKTKKIEELKANYQQITNQKNKYIINHDFNKALMLKQQELELESKINNLEINQHLLTKKVVTLKDIAIVIKNKSNVPVYEIDKDSLKNLKDLEINLKKEIIGQDTAIELLCQETKKIKLGLKKSDKPISFLFTGKSGVGKTELVKKYAEFLKMNLIRLDGSEFKESHTTSKILGSPPGYVGYNDHNLVFESLKSNPYAVILLDEVEKAHSSILNLFLQILDEGMLTTSDNEKINFNHAIVIITSNITSNINSIGFKQDNNKNMHDKLENTLSTEFISGINHVIQFNDLTKDDIKKIILKKIKEVKAKFKEENITLSIEKKAIDEMIKSTNYRIKGARKIEKILEDKIDNIVIDNMLNGVKHIKIKNFN